MHCKYLTMTFTSLTLHVVNLLISNVKYHREVGEFRKSQDTKQTRIRSGPRDDRNGRGTYRVRSGKKEFTTSFFIVLNPQSNISLKLFLSKTYSLLYRRRFKTLPKVHV